MILSYYYNIRENLVIFIPLQINSQIAHANVDTIAKGRNSFLTRMTQESFIIALMDNRL